MGVTAFDVVTPIMIHMKVLLTNIMQEVTKEDLMVVAVLTMIRSIVMVVTIINVIMIVVIIDQRAILREIIEAQVKIKKLTVVVMAQHDWPTPVAIMKF